LARKQLRLIALRRYPVPLPWRVKFTLAAGMDTKNPHLEGWGRGGGGRVPSGQSPDADAAFVVFDASNPGGFREALPPTGGGDLNPGDFLLERDLVQWNKERHAGFHFMERKPAVFIRKPNRRRNPSLDLDLAKVVAGRSAITALRFA